MKQLLTITLLVNLSLSFAATGELDKISLITPLSYERAHSSSQTIKSKIQIAVGDLINTDVVGQVKSKIEPYKKDLKPYFSSQAELDTFVDKVANEGKNKILGKNLSDTKLIQFYEHLGNSLIGGIADRILTKEGVTDTSRRAMWVAKILTPFKVCINKAANALYDASSCVDSLSESLVPSAGIGIVYELSRSSLGSNLPDGQKAGFYAEQVSIYKDCMNRGNGAASEVKKCALTAMKNGVQKVTEGQLSKTINKSAATSATAKSIKQDVWPGFTTCTSKVGTTSSSTSLTDQFMNCIDDLVKTTGTYLVQDKLSNIDSVKTNFSRDELNTLVLEKKDFFEKCVDDQKRDNVRKNGMLNTDLCENQITNDVTYKVVVKTLQKTANDSIKGAASSLASKLENEGKVLLDRCWNDQQSSASRESCLRKTILSFSNSIAAIKLDQAIPPSIASKDDVLKSSLKDLQKCMDKQLPDNISEAPSIGTLTEACTSKLTKNVASIVARETVMKKVLESSLSIAEAEALLASEVDKKFNSCIGSKPSDEKLGRCSGELKKNVAMILASKQIRSNAQGKVSPMETDTLVSTLVNQQFAGCIGDNPSDSKLDSCITDLTKEATKSIVIGYEKKQLKEQLNSEITPTNIKTVEDEFVACVYKKRPPEKVTSELDECTKQFSLGFARTLGELKLTRLLRSVLGSDGYNDQKKSIDDILSNYYSCLDNLKSIPMNDGLLDRLTVCTDELQKRGVNFVTGTVNNWMSSEQKDAATLMVKNEFSNFIPCLGSLLPSPPYSQKLDQNVKSVMKPVAALLAQYIDYSPENAKRTLDDVIKKLSGDLKDVASNPNSRKELIDYLYLNGALDQFLKSMVRGKVKEALEQIPESDVPKELSNALLAKSNFDTIFASAEGKQITEMVMDKILKPVLMEQTSMDSPLMKLGMDAVQAKVTRMLVYAPSFGDQIIKTSIQNKLNSKSGFEKTIAKWIYGSNSMNWDKVRLSERGQAAEDYIRERYLMLKFSSAPLSKNEEEKIMGEAEKLVKEAVTNFKE